MRYKTLDGSTKRVASTSGHVVLVGDKFVEVPEHMEAEARALGCISEDMFNKIKDGGDGGITNHEPPELTGEERVAKMVEAIKDMAAEDDSQDNFTSQGLPNKRKLFSMCGFRPTDEEFEQAWDRVKKELAEDE